MGQGSRATVEALVPGQGSRTTVEAPDSWAGQHNYGGSSGSGGLGRAAQLRWKLRQWWWFLGRGFLGRAAELRWKLRQWR